jgi:hypothetical protein
VSHHHPVITSKEHEPRSPSVVTKSSSPKGGEDGDGAESLSHPVTWKVGSPSISWRDFRREGKVRGELYAGGGVDDNFSIVARRALAGGSGRGASALESIVV